MRSLGLVLVLLSLTTPQLQAGSLKKAYFGATHPGTWAKYESSWEMPDGKSGTNVYTYVRATDSAGRVRIEIQTEVLAGPGKGVISRQLFVMEPGFDLAGDYLNHMMFVEASVAQTGDGPAFPMQDDVIKILRESAGDLTNSVTFKGKAKRGGSDCDNYAYSYRSGGPHSTLNEGEICLAETVPFGVVFQKGRATDAAGELLSSFEQRLVDSGSGRAGAAALMAMTPETKPLAQGRAASKAPPSLPFLEAYQSEKVSLSVEVEKGTGGRRLSLIVRNETKAPLDVVVPSGPLTIPADSPLGVLRLVVAAEQRLSLSPGGSSAPLAVGQPGERGATGGKFRLIVFEGKPLFQGSVDVGPLK